MKIDRSIIGKLERFQKNEITEHFIYSKLSESIRDEHNSTVLKRIADDELRHYQVMKKYTGKEIKPNKWHIFKYYWISRLFGITFGIKLMERGEEAAQEAYEEVAGSIKEMMAIIKDENKHEKELINMLKEEHLKYVGSVVLGLNDALVELTGTLAGLSFALQNTRLIALAGLITGIAASFSMAASEYLSTKADNSEENALVSSIYTGVAYIITVFILILPYLIFSHYLLCLAVTISNALLIIFVFNFYISVAQDLPFKKRFLEMASISIGVALLSFGIGYIIRSVIGIDV